MAGGDFRPANEWAEHRSVFLSCAGGFRIAILLLEKKVAEGSDPSVGKRRWILFGPRAHPIMHDTILNAATV